MKKNTIKNIVVIFFITAFTKVLGFSREVVLASYLGVDAIADSYFTATSIPIILFSVVVSALGAAFMPLYSGKFRVNGQEEADKFASNVLNCGLIVSIIITIIGYTFSEQIVKIFVPGFSQNMIGYTANITKYLFLTLAFSMISGMLASILQSREKVIITSLLGIPMNVIVMLVTIFYFDEYGIKALIIANFVSIIVQILIQVLPIRKIFKYKLILNINDADIVKLIKLIGPVMITTLCIQMNLMIDKAIGSFKGDGAISILNYANKIITIISGLFITTIISVYYPKFMKYSSTKRDGKLFSIINDAKKTLSIIVIPGTLLLIVVSENLIGMMFMRDTVDIEVIKKIRNVLVIYCIGLPSIASRELMVKVAYSIQKHKYVMINSIISLGLNLVLNLGFSLVLGVEGIALATTISVLITTSHMKRSISKFINIDTNNKIINRRYYMFILLASTIATIGANIVNTEITFNNDIIKTLNTSIIFFVIYISIIGFANAKVIKVVFNKKLRREGN